GGRGTVLMGLDAADKLAQTVPVGAGGLRAAGIYRNKPTEDILAGAALEPYVGKRARKGRMLDVRPKQPVLSPVLKRRKKSTRKWRLTPLWESDAPVTGRHASVWLPRGLRHWRGRPSAPSGDGQAAVLALLASALHGPDHGQQQQRGHIDPELRRALRVGRLDAHYIPALFPARTAG